MQTKVRPLVHMDIPINIQISQADKEVGENATMEIPGGKELRKKISGNLGWIMVGFFGTKLMGIVIGPGTPII